MKNLLLLVVILFSSCKKEKWEVQWEKDNDRLKKAVKLLKEDKLERVYGRSGYRIPDSLGLQTPYSGLAIRQTDFTYDSTYSIVFYLNGIENRNLAKPAFVYTDNQKRINEYEKGRTAAKKLEENWYYTPE